LSQSGRVRVNPSRVRVNKTPFGIFGFVPTAVAGFYSGIQVAQKFVNTGIIKQGTLMESRWAIFTSCEFRVANITTLTRLFVGFGRERRYLPPVVAMNLPQQT
jgi:hypothetical protein